MNTTETRPETIRAPVDVPAGTPPDIPPAAPESDTLDGVWAWYPPGHAPAPLPPRPMQPWGANETASREAGAAWLAARDAAIESSNEPRSIPALRVTEAAQVEAAAAAFAVRNKARGLSPLIFLAPAVVDAFKKAAWARLDGDAWWQRPPYNGSDFDAGDYISAALYTCGDPWQGWTLVTLDRCTEDEAGDPMLRYTTLAGRPLVPYAPPPPPMLPEREREIVARVLAVVKRTALAAKEDDSYDRASDWFPSEVIVSNILAREQGEPVAAVTEEPAPDSKLADQVERIIGKYVDDKGHGPRRADIEKRVTARRQAVTATLAWLQRAGRITRERRGRADEYRPTDAAA